MSDRVGDIVRIWSGLTTIDGTIKMISTKGDIWVQPNDRKLSAIKLTSQHQWTNTSADDRRASQ